MGFTLLFQNLPDLTTVIIECGIDCEQVRVIPHHLISRNDWRKAIDFPGSYLYAATVIFPIKLNMKLIVYHSIKELIS